MSSAPLDRDALVEAALAAARGVCPGPAGGDPGRTSERESEAFLALARQARALVSLPRVAAPAALEGRVVAALHGGAREARAVAVVSALERRTPPAVLDRLVGEVLDPLRAPRELDGRVATQLEAGVGPSLVQSLPRVPTPRALAERLAAPGGLAPARPGRSGVSGPARRALAALALAAVAVLGALLVAGDRRPGARPLEDAGADPARGPVALRERAPIAITFEFVEHESLATAPLGPRERALVSAFVGELLGGGS